MEDIKLYIESGILELYVMGDLSPEERLEVEKMAFIYPAVAAELKEIEKALQGYSDAYTITPSENLRERIIGSLETKSNQINNNSAVDETAKVIALPAQRYFYKYAFAASVALLLISWLALFSVYSRLQNSQEQIALLEVSNQKFTSRVNYIDRELTDTKRALSVLRNPEFKLIKLQGTKNSPSSSMMVAFNPKEKEVMIDLASLKMPANAPTQQYQLWALVDGKPVDLGVFDMETNNTGMKLMKSISEAQAFAVTLEPRGGSANPTMDQMMVMGGI